MTKKSWIGYLEDSLYALNVAERSVNKAAQELMLEKGFSKKQIHMFGANFASGDEALLTFNTECADSDLDITVAAGMTKDEIIKRLSRYASDETVKLLKGE
jgi:hypothetical protein